MIFYLFHELCALNIFKSDIAKIEQRKKSFVCVETRVSISGSFDGGYYKGSGFVFDKEKGLVVTNHHVSSGNSVSSIEIIFSNGRRAEARHVWSHPFVDLSILKLDPKELQDLEFTAVPIAKTKPHLNEEVEIYSNNLGYNFSAHKGQITSLYEDTGFFPVQNMRISTNASCGASGSAVLNNKGEIIAVVFAGDNTSLFAIPIDYLKTTALKVGATNFNVTYLPIDDAINYCGYSREDALRYNTKYPESFNKILMVSSCPPNEKCCKPGDIILSVNGKEVGPSLLLYNQEVDKAFNMKKPLTITILRQGKKMDIQIPIRPAFLPSRYIKFGGALFMESNEIMYSTLGVPLKTPIVVKVDPGSLFHIFPAIGGTNQYAIALEELHNQSIKTFDDLERVIRGIIKSKTKYITCIFKDYGVFQGYNNAVIKNGNSRAQATSAKQEDDFVMYKYTLKPTKDGDQWLMDVVK